MNRAPMSQMAKLAGLLWLLLAAPVVLPAPAWAIDVQKVVSPGGIEAWLVRDEKNPIISMQFSFDGGVELDPADKLGLARMVSTLLDEGAGDLKSEAFQEKLENNSISLSFSAGRDGFMGGVTTLKANAKLAFELLQLSLNRPRFDAEAIERMRNAMLVTLKRSQADPGYAAQRAFAQTVFKGHPYANPTEGTPATVAKIQRDDLVGFVKRRFAKDTLKIGVSGDIQPDELGRVLDQVFGGLPAKADPVVVPDFTSQGAGEMVEVKRPVPQTTVLIGQPGIKRQDPDWYAALVLNYVLGGGGFSSRLMDEVREKRGLTYGVSSGLQPFEHSALVTVRASTVNDVAGQAIDLIRQIWGEVQQKGITQKELDDAKTYLTGSYALSFTNNNAIASIVLQVQRDKLGIDYLNQRNALIEKVSLADANRVAKRLLDPKKLAVVVTGQPKGVQVTRTLEPVD